MGEHGWFSIKKQLICIFKQNFVFYYLVVKIIMLYAIMSLDDRKVLHILKIIGV